MSNIEVMHEGQSSILEELWKEYTSLVDMDNEGVRLPGDSANVMDLSRINGEGPNLD